MSETAGTDRDAVLAQFDADIAEAEARLVQLRHDRTVLATVLGDARLLELVAKYSGLRPDDAVIYVAPDRAGSVVGGSRKALVWNTVLQSGAENFQTKTITRLLHEDGHELENVQVSNALSALARDGRIRSTPRFGKGHWELVRGQVVDGASLRDDGTAEAVPSAQTSSPLAMETKAG